MNAKEYIHCQIASVRHLSDVVVQDVTDEQFNWAPPGTANSISATLVHMFIGEDRIIHTVLQGKPPVWAADGWDKRIGLSAPPAQGANWDHVSKEAPSIGQVVAYGQAIRAETDAYLAGLTAEELNRMVSFLGSERPVGDVLAMLVSHTMHHAGEICAVKGIQGVKGLPF